MSTRKKPPQRIIQIIHNGLIIDEQSSVRQLWDKWHKELGLNNMQALYVEITHCEYLTSRTEEYVFKATTYDFTANVDYFNRSLNRPKPGKKEPKKRQQNEQAYNDELYEMANEGWNHKAITKKERSEDDYIGSIKAY